MNGLFKWKILLIMNKSTGLIYASVITADAFLEISWIITQFMKANFYFLFIHSFILFYSKQASFQ